MDTRRKKELLQEFKNRRLEMGVISYKCKATGESFLGASNDTKADFNSTTMKLSMGYHPNRRLLELWKEYGKEGFELSILKILDYKDGDKKLLEKVENLREECFAVDEQANKLWR